MDITEQQLVVCEEQNKFAFELLDLACEVICKRLELDGTKEQINTVKTALSEILKENKEDVINKCKSVID